jgi:subtilisin family serine protease
MRALLAHLLLPLFSIAAVASMPAAAATLSVAPARTAASASEAVAANTSASVTHAFDRQLLVMLRLSSARAKAAYGGRGPRRRSARAPGRAAADKLARDHDLSVLADWPIPALGLDCYVMQTAPGVARDAALRDLSSDRRVQWAQPMRVFSLLGVGDPLYAAQPASRWHLRELHSLATGKGVVVAQVDSGVALNHPDLRGQIAGTRNFVPDQDFLPEIHGTEVAGIIVARADNGIGIAGVAPQAKLLALRACWQLADNSAQCNSFTLAMALQFALREHAQVINLSLSGPPDPLLTRLLDVAHRQGVIVIGAVDARAMDGGFPASHPDVIAVAANGDAARIAGALHAPGRDIPTTLLADDWGMVSGSSFAAAQVSGLAALLRQMAPTLRPEQFRDSMRARGAGPGAADSAPVDACAAIERASRRCACECTAKRSDAALGRH